VIFFFASAAASSAYLTVSEVFPLELRALAIAVFYAVGAWYADFTQTEDDEVTTLLSQAAHRFAQSHASGHP